MTTEKISAMAANGRSMTAPVMWVLGLFVVANLCIAGVHSGSVGVCYGTLGDNLPPPLGVVALFVSNGINRMRIYDPNPVILDALTFSNIELLLGIPNHALPPLAADPLIARSFVELYVMTHFPAVKFRYLVVGNEVSPINGDTMRFARFVLPAMKNLNDAVVSFGLDTKVSTAIGMNLIGNSYPPSEGAFSEDVRSYLDPIMAFLVEVKAPLLANIYPYLSYAGNPEDISLPCALFTSSCKVVRDGPHRYHNLFDVMLDTLYSALEKAGKDTLEVVVSETGWPSAGGFAATLDNARIYNQNLVKHVKAGGGTPKRPNKTIEAYIFSVFDEDLKLPELEKYWGLFFPDMRPKYPINFGQEMIKEVSDGCNMTTPFTSEM